MEFYTFDSTFGVTKAWFKIVLATFFEKWPDGLILNITAKRALFQKVASTIALRWPKSKPLYLTFKHNETTKYESGIKQPAIRRHLTSPTKRSTKPTHVVAFGTWNFCCDGNFADLWLTPLFWCYVEIEPWEALTWCSICWIAWEDEPARRGLLEGQRAKAHYNGFPISNPNWRSAWIEGSTCWSANGVGCRQKTGCSPWSWSEMSANTALHSGRTPRGSPSDTGNSTIRHLRLCIGISVLKGRGPSPSLSLFYRSPSALYLFFVGWATKNNEWRRDTDWTNFL